MNITEYTFETHLIDKPVKLLHITDQHITGADESDDDHARAEAKRREPVFYQEPLQAERNFEKLIAFAEENEFDGIIFTGDIIDFPSKYNMKYLAKKLKALKIPYAFAIGNHDWCYADEPPREPTKVLHFPEIEQEIGVNLRMDTFEIAGITVATFDNSLFRVKDYQTEFLKKEIEKGKPLIAAFHHPIATESVMECTIKHWGRPVMMAVPEEKAQEYKIPYATADEPTAEFCKLLAESDNVIGVFVGDIHCSHICSFGNNKFQIVSDIGVWGCATAVTLIPKKA